jgi:hypothetical protein
MPSSAGSAPGDEQPMKPAQLKPAQAGASWSCAIWDRQNSATLRSARRQRQGLRVDDAPIESFGSTAKTAPEPVANRVVSKRSHTPAV